MASRFPPDKSFLNVKLSQPRANNAKEKQVEWNHEAVATLNCLAMLTADRGLSGDDDALPSFPNIGNSHDLHRSSPGRRSKNSNTKFDITCLSTTASPMRS